MLDFIKTCIATIKHAPICDLGKRQQRLIELLVHIVNHETLDGTLTAQAGNKALEGMDYWLSLNEYLKDAGFKRLGNGHFSAAYKHAALPGRVFKVGFKKEDSGAAYVAFCRMHQGLPGIPVIHDVQRHAGCYTVVMDEMMSLRAADNNGIKHVYEMHEMAEAGVEGVEIDVDSVDTMDDWSAGLYHTGKLINGFFKGIASFDMHQGNAMVDPKTGKVYITDPVSFSLDADGDRKFGQDDWALDLEAIEKEREEILTAQLVERCKRRWKANEMRKDGAQSKRCKARRVSAKIIAKERSRERVAVMDHRLVHLIAELHMSAEHRGNVFDHHNWHNVDIIQRQNVEAFRVDNQLRILAGRPLACDVELDKRFLG